MPSMRRPKIAGQPNAGAQFGRGHLVGNDAYEVEVCNGKVAYISRLPFALQQDSWT